MAIRNTPRRSASPASAARRPSAAATPHLKLVKKALDDMKAVDVRLLDVRGLSDIADWMIVASGNSDRHVRSIADHVVQQAKASGTRPFGTEGGSEGEWVLVDLPDVLVHVMLPRVREFYALEELWDRPAAKAPAARVPATARKPPAARLPPAARKPAAASKPGARRGATRAR